MARALLRHNRGAFEVWARRCRGGRPCGSDPIAPGKIFKQQGAVPVMFCAPNEPTHRAIMKREIQKLRQRAARGDSVAALACAIFAEHTCEMTENSGSAEGFYKQAASPLHGRKAIKTQGGNRATSQDIIERPLRQPAPRDHLLRARQPRPTARPPR